MKLKTKYLLLFSIILLLMLFVTIVVYQQSRVLFVVCELAIILAVILFVKLYQAIFRPFSLLNAGVSSITDKDFSIKILPVGQPEMDNLIEVYNKMIEQLRLERTIAYEKNFFLEKVIDASPAAIIILDKNNDVKSINPAASQLLQINNETIQTINDFPSPWNIELLHLNEIDSTIIQANGIIRYKCNKSYFIDRGVKQAFFLIEELTKEIMNAERLSYEKIIRMMSHEVNNSVGSINSIIKSTIKYLNGQDNNANIDFINALHVAKDRIINLNLFTKRFANIVHIPPPELTECNLIESINQTIIYLYNDLQRKNITINKKFGESSAEIIFDIQQLELVLINILKNAIQAMNSEGIINIIYEDKTQSLIIENNGESIPPEIQKKLFEPFFTTKKTGQGIGLTLIREILSNHNCDFSLKTRTDNITEFRIVFCRKESLGRLNSF